MDIDALQPKALEIHQRLIEEYGDRPWRQRLDPVEVLVGTILSQNTNDTNRDVAHERLRARFPTWEEVRDAPAEEIIDAIRPAGLANQKGPRIQRALRTITAERGEISLDFLAEMELEDARRWLSSIKGVGPKTAAIVLLFCFNRPAFPVDTHVHRVSKRLGLIGPKTSREKAHSDLEALMPPETYYAFHLNIIAHGRRVCQARTPQCAVCVLQELCEYYSTA